MIYYWTTIFLLLQPLQSIAAEAHDSLFWEDLDQALSKGRKKQQVTLVFAQTEGCGPCSLMKTAVFPQVRSLMQQVALAEIDFSDHSTRIKINNLELSSFEWARHFGLNATPSFALVDHQGRHIISQTGQLDVKTFGLFLAYGSTGAYRHGSFQDYLNSMHHFSILEPSNTPAHQTTSNSIFTAVLKKIFPR